MQRSDLEKLARTHAFPAVTILLATDRRRPGNAEDRLRLRHLVDTATERLLREHDRREVQPLIERLHRAGADADLAHPGAGLAILATADEAQVHRVPFPLPERVVVNETFALRDLLLGLHRTPRYRVLVLSPKVSRLVDVTAGAATEVHDGGFPVSVEPPREEGTPHRDLPIHETQDAEAHRFVFRAVDRAFGAVHARDPLPTVCSGVERDVAYFEEVTVHGSTLVGRVHGNHTGSPPHEVAAVAAPVAEAYFAGRRRDAVRAVEDAIGAHRAALGVDEVWSCARDGRGRLLVVEEGFALPVRVTGAHLEPAGEGDDRAVDAVDEIADAVLATGGDVEFVEPGALAAHDHIALVLRY